MSIDLTITGRRFGYLVAEYSRRHDIACRCICDRLVHIAAEALTNGTVTSCGCQPAPRAFWIQYHELRAQLYREIQFGIAKGAITKKRPRARRVKSPLPLQNVNRKTRAS
jgi:hypothetical protein